VNDDVSVIQDDPPITCNAFTYGGFMVLALDPTQNGVAKAIQHPIARPAGNHKIICKVSNFFNVQENDVFTLFPL